MSLVMRPVAEGAGDEHRRGDRHAQRHQQQHAAEHQQADGGAASCGVGRPSSASAAAPASAAPPAPAPPAPSAPGPAPARHRSTTSAGRGSSRSRRPRAPPARRRAVRQASSAHMAASSSAPMRVEQRLRGARASFWVKKSTMMLAPCSWHHGRHSEMASAMPNCVSSTSPGIGLRDRRARDDADHRHQRHDAGDQPAGQREPQRDAPQQHRLGQRSRRRQRLARAACGLAHLLVLRQQVARVLQHRLPLAPALVHVGDPLVVQRRPRP